MAQCSLQTIALVSLHSNNPSPFLHGCGRILRRVTLSHISKAHGVALNCYFEMKEKIVFADTGKYEGYIDSVWDVPGKDRSSTKGGRKKKTTEESREICSYAIQPYKISGIFPQFRKFNPGLLLERRFFERKGSRSASSRPGFCLCRLIVQLIHAADPLALWIMTFAWTVTVKPHSFLADKNLCFPCMRADNTATKTQVPEQSAHEFFGATCWKGGKVCQKWKRGHQMGVNKTVLQGCFSLPRRCKEASVLMRIKLWGREDKCWLTAHRWINGREESRACDSPQCCNPTDSSTTTYPKNLIPKAGAKSPRHGGICCRLLPGQPR